MPIGIIANSSAVAIGAIIGALAGKKLPQNLRTTLPILAGFISMSMGIFAIIKMQTLPAVVLSVLIGTVIGELLHIEKGIAAAIEKIKSPMEKMMGKSKHRSDDFSMEKYISIAVLFCASGTGIYGALHSGITGDHTILITKAFLDLFTSMIFSASLGILVAFLCIPQFLILLILYCMAVVIMPLTNPTIIGDFTACGGILMLATGFRINEIKSISIANMLPAMVLVMPLSYLWNQISFF
ncbi:MAG: hypothetical protein A2Y21_02545 [Clostridiales bacterium GWC2_40_7]|nr:MAG: hypothetical protein A2Y21_02545 [Clostridiales bacterium GWC2_40_7]